MCLGRTQVPVYILPPLAIFQHLEQATPKTQMASAAAYYFAQGMSLHFLRLAVNGVFDEFPRRRSLLQMGENAVGQRWRVDDRLDFVRVPRVYR